MRTVYRCRVQRRYCPLIVSGILNIDLPASLDISGSQEMREGLTLHDYPVGIVHVDQGCIIGSGPENISTR
jgi:hypothetical protein